MTSTMKLVTNMIIITHVITFVIDCSIERLKVIKRSSSGLVETAISVGSLGVYYSALPVIIPHQENTQCSEIDN